MAQNYINLGLACLAFSGESTPSTISTVYIRNATGTPLNPSGTVIASGFPLLTGTSNTFNYSSIAFNVYFDENLVRFASDRQNWRYIGTSAPTYSETSGVQNQTITTASWNPLTYPLSVTHPAPSGTSYSIVQGTDSTLETWLKSSYVSLPSGLPGAPVGGVTTSTAIYLYQTASTGTYLALNGATLSTVTPSVASGVAATPFYFSYSVQTGVKITLVISDTNGGSGSPVNGIIYKANGTVDVTISGTTMNYSITCTQPVLGENPTGFPSTSSTLLKHVNSGKYVYWNGVSTSGTISSGTSYTSAAAPSLSLVDYWQSGITSSQIMQGLQFKFWDLTGTTTAATATDATMKDWYGWLVVKDVTKAPAFNNTTNVAITNSNVLYIGQGTAGTGTGFGPVIASSTAYPSTFEGWVFENDGGTTTNPMQIAYVRNSTIPPSGAPTQVGYLTSLDGNQLTFVASSTRPVSTNANNFQCFQCTGLTGTNSYCNPIGGGGTSSTGTTTAAISISFVSGAWYLRSSNVLTMPMTTTGISSSSTNVTLSINGQTLNPSLSTTTIRNDYEDLTYALNNPTTYTPGSSYTFNFGILGRIASPQNISTTLTLPSTRLGTISGGILNSVKYEGVVTFSTLAIAVGTTFLVHINNNTSSPYWATVVTPTVAYFNISPILAIPFSKGSLPITAYLNTPQYFPTTSSTITSYEDSLDIITNVVLSKASRTGTVTFQSSTPRVSSSDAIYITGLGSMIINSPAIGSSSTTYNITYASSITFNAGTSLYAYSTTGSPISSVSNFFNFTLSA